ncbi:MAG: family hydrolase [Haloplasmataceae bacterium]|nr:family hydrolase [Haloplasmataceae bacterium]
MYKGYLIDLDGVAYMGKNVIPTCLLFINRIRKLNVKFCFVTNNSSRTNEEVCKHLNELGYNVTVDNIITSSEVTANYIKDQKPKAKVFIIGMNGLKTTLQNSDLQMVEENADYVVVGLDKNLTYQKLAQATFEINKGATFISTNSDLRLSTENGIAPGNGAITKVIELATGIEPIYMGKPQIEMLEFGLNKLNLNKKEVAMIGDNYFTDILGAYNFGIDSIFVETGVMKISDLNNFKIKPTHIVKDLSELK